MSLRKLVDLLRDEIDACHVSTNTPVDLGDQDEIDNIDDVQDALHTLEKIESEIDNIEGWNNDIKTVIEKAEDSEYLESLVDELTEPVDNIGRTVY